MDEDRDVSDGTTVLSPLARASARYPKGLKPKNSYSGLPDPSDGLDPNTNMILHRPPDRMLHREQPISLLPSQAIAPNTNPAPISTSTVLGGGSGNALHNSTASVANRDLNQGNVYNFSYTTYISYTEQGSSYSQQKLFPADTPLTPSTLATRTAVTSSYPQDTAPHPIMPPNPSTTASFATAHHSDPTVLSSQCDNRQATGANMTEGQETEPGSFEITLIEDLDMDLRHQPEAWYRSSDGLSHAGIYIRKIYPSAHGYPCPNPCFEGPPVRIGDIGILNSAGFTALANLADCQLPSLQSLLASLALSDPWHKAGYFPEGHSITGGALVDETRWPLFDIIRNIKYRCHAPQGAILAVTSPAQLHTLPQDRNHRLRVWLSKHGMDLLQSVDPGRTEPLYIVTGKVTSSSWATATYSEPMIAPDDELVLTPFFRAVPPYRWTEPKNARTMSQSSSTVDAQGKIASDQCLFLRGFLLTPSPQYMNRQARHALKTSDDNPGISESHPNVDGTRGTSGEGSSQFTPSVHPSSRSGASHEGTMGQSARGSERGDLLIEEVPSLSAVDFYPSHRINKRLLELTDADLAITHDDDWRLRLEGQAELIQNFHEVKIEGLPDRNYGVMDNIGNEGDVLPSTNSGVGDMASISIGFEDEFMLTLPNRLKVCRRADHRYRAPDGEATLRDSQCTPGTRVHALQGILDWATNTSPNGEPVFWLSGQAGSGKTTIAYTIACYFEALVTDGNSNAMLGASFFCSRQFFDTRSASSIVRTIVYQLALRSKPFRAALKEHGRFETVNHDPKSQIMGLLVLPWAKSARERLANNEPCYVIPIDAVNELARTGGTGFLGALFDVVKQQDLSGLKIFITSQSDPDLVTQIASFSNKRVYRLEEVPLDESSADINIFLSKSLAQCATVEQIQQLVSDAAGLFIYAATVVKCVKGRNVKEQKKLLPRLLSTSSSSVRQPRILTMPLDDMYRQILETSLMDPTERGERGVLQDRLAILHTFVCTIERTSISVAIDILNAGDGSEEMALDTGIAEGVLHRLHAVLYSQGSKVMFYHKSFADFLLDQDRTRVFFCNQEQHHLRLAEGCFAIMAKQLRFNIADTPSSYMMDHNHPNLATCIDTNISATLRYACENWSAHLILTDVNAMGDLTETLDKFLLLQFLFWMEAMNLLGEIVQCGNMLRDIQQWISKSKASMELVGKLADAAEFAVYHSTSKAALSTPHLYLSSLATFPRNSALVQSWRQQFGGIPEFIGAQGVGSEAVACVTVTNDVKALAISPDGVNVAVGATSDGLVHVCNMFTTGENVGVLKGHTDNVLAVGFSPDGTHVVSGSDDESVRVWDLSAREHVWDLRGHTGPVSAVRFSPDGTHIVSGSGDNSVRVWDLSTGEHVWDLRGHTGAVSAVAYSPDGTHVVSGSYDQSIRLWDLSIGEEIRVLQGHSSQVRAVAYSPDGLFIASGSDDRSVRVWDVSTGEEVKVFQGHSDRIGTVAYSPDGNYIISGSDDKSVYVWDLSSGEEVGVVRGHTGAVDAMARSLGMSSVVSSLGDKFAQMWKLSTGQAVRYHKGHPGAAIAAPHSPDGTHVVSGLAGQSVWEWDISPEHSPRYVHEQGPDGEYTGWLLSPNDSSAYLMFVGPQDMLPDDSTILIFPTTAVSHVDFSNAKLGDRWTECYTPSPLQR